MNVQEINRCHFQPTKVATKCNQMQPKQPSYQVEAILKVAVHSINSINKKSVCVLPLSDKSSLLSKLFFREPEKSILSSAGGVVGLCFYHYQAADRADAKLCVAGANNPHHHTMPAYH